MSKILIHEAMRQARVEAGLSQGELAERANVYQCSLSKYERGLQVPRLYTAIQLSEALGLSLEEYLGLREK